MKGFSLFLPLAVLTLACLIAAVIIFNKPVAKRQSAHAKPLAVEALTLKPQQFPVIVTTQGTVEARTTTTLISRVTGEVGHVSPAFRPGGFFEPGDTLLTIDDTDYKLDIKLAQAALAEARFNLQEEQAQSDQASDNWKLLGRTESPSDLVLRKPQLAQAKAAVESARAQLQRVRLNLRRTRITTPYAGRILEQFVDIGQYVTPGSQLAKIYAIDYAEIRLPLREKQRGMIDLPRLYRGESDQTYQGPVATIHANIGGKSYLWKGRVMRTEGSVDRATRQVYVIVQVDNPDGRRSDNRPPLEIGQFVTAEIQGRVLESVFLVPRTAVQGSDTIMVVDVQSRIHRKKINVLWETRDNVIINEGLRSGERLCTTYVPFVANNAKVQLASEVNKRLSSAHEEPGSHTVQGKKQRVDDTPVIRHKIPAS